MNSIAVVAALHSAAGGSVCFPMTSLFSVLVGTVLRGCLRLDNKLHLCRKFGPSPRLFIARWTFECIVYSSRTCYAALMKNKLSAGVLWSHVV